MATENPWTEDESASLMTDVEGKRSSSSCCRPSFYRSSKFFLILFMVGALAILLVGAVYAVDNYYSQDAATSGASHIHPSHSQSQSGLYRYAAVATDTVPCSTIGTDMLATKGGSVVDAAIATTLCAGIVNMHSCGIGGGHFMIIYAAPRNESEKVTDAMMAREMAPGAATEDMFTDGTSSSVGPMSIAIPGEIKGLHEAWKKYGRLPWRQLFDPTISMLRTGYQIVSALGGNIKKNEEMIRNDPAWSELFVRDGRLLETGDILTNDRLADTMERIAEDPDTFYTGSLADDIIKDLNEKEALITHADLEHYSAKWATPLRAPLKSLNWTVHSIPPPSAAAIFPFIWRIMEGYDLSNKSIANDEATILTYHRFVESAKYAFAQKSYIGDPDFVDSSEVLARMYNQTYIDYIRSSINDDKTYNIPHYHPAGSPSGDSGTSHLSILAPDGSAVAVTTSINNEFGSQIRGSRTGIIFNDQMDDFASPGPPEEGMPPPEADFIKPYKRPTSSMSPTLLIDQDGQVRLVIGASGGTKIPTSTAYVSLHHLLMGERLQFATDRLRLYHRLSPNIVDHDKGFDETLLAGLRAKGHETREISSYAVVQTVRDTCPPCPTGVCKRQPCIQAVSDYRKQGTPDGY